MSYKLIKVKSKVSKRSFGIMVYAGDILKVTIDGEGQACLLRNQNFKLKPEEFEYYLSDTDFNKLLYS